MASANSLMREMQKIASDAQVQVQKLANEASEKSFKYNSEEANTARAWQKEMSDTAHQREVKDLVKAGLNPVLATNNGAQSYTTSSASAQANDPSASIGALAGNLIQSRTNAYSADTSAAATRAAAAQSASAQRYAASQAAAAQRYAAAMAYQTRKDEYKWKQDYMKSEYKAKTDYMKSEYSEKLKQPVSNFAGLIDKYAQRTGLADKIVSNSTVKTVVSSFDKFVKNPAGSFIDLGKRFTSNAYSGLNQRSQDQVNYALNKLHIKANRNTRNLLTNAIFNGNSGSWNQLIKYIPKKNKISNNILLGSYAVPISARSNLR